MGASVLRSDRAGRSASLAGRRSRRVNPPGDRRTVIALRNVAVRREGVVVLDHIDWQVRLGERWVILGPNGSGKTTLLGIAGARLWPSGGLVEILGAQLGHVDVRTLRPRIALVSGSVTRQLRADLPARHVVVSGLYAALETWWHSYSEDDWLKADRLLEEAGVAAIAERSESFLKVNANKFCWPERSWVSLTCSSLTNRPPASTSGPGNDSLDVSAPSPPIRGVRPWCW